MKKPGYSILLCCLLALFFAACNNCNPDTYRATYQTNFVPYASGSTFAMTAGNGRVIHFQDTLFNDQVFSDAGNVCACCDVNEKQQKEASFKSDSSGIYFNVWETAGGKDGNVTDDDFSLQWPGGSFYATLPNNTMVGFSGHTATARGSVAIGNVTYSDVYEIYNGLAPQNTGPNRIWYNRTNGLLKIAFTDSTTWTIVN
jgi:hypothetical protein